MTKHKVPITLLLTVIVSHQQDHTDTSTPQFLIQKQIYGTNKRHQ